MVTMISMAGGATILVSTTMTSADVSFDALRSTVRSSVDRVSSSLEVRGSVIARSSDSKTADSIGLTLALLGEGAVQLGEHAVQLGDADGASEPLIISYRDDSTYLPSLPYSVDFLSGDRDSLLERGETVHIAIEIADAALTANERFSLELTSPVGGTVEINRIIRYVLQPVMSLH